MISICFNVCTRGTMQSWSVAGGRSYVWKSHPQVCMFSSSWEHSPLASDSIPAAEKAYKWCWKRSRVSALSSRVSFIPLGRLFASKTSCGSLSEYKTCFWICPCHWVFVCVRSGEEHFLLFPLTERRWTWKIPFTGKSVEATHPVEGREATEEGEGSVCRCRTTLLGPRWSGGGAKN